MCVCVCVCPLSVCALACSLSELIFVHIVFPPVLLGRLIKSHGCRRSGRTASHQAFYRSKERGEQIPFQIQLETDCIIFVTQRRLQTQQITWCVIRFKIYSPSSTVWTVQGQQLPALLVVLPLFSF